MSHDKKQVKCSREPTPLQLPEALDLPLITNTEVDFKYQTAQ